VNEKYSLNANATIWTENHGCDYNKLKLFIDHGADVNARDNTGNTALHNLIEQCNVESVRFLVDSGADVNIVNNNGQSALFAAAKNASTVNIGLLVARGANVNAVDRYGNTPLHVAAAAAATSSQDAVDLLLKSGANRDVRNAEGKSLSDIVGESRGGLLSARRIASAIGPRSGSTLSLTGDAGRAQKLKELIVSKLKDGAKQINYDREGSSEVAYENGVYVYRFTNKAQTVSQELVYGTDEQVVNFMFNKYKNVNQNNLIYTYEFILSNLF
jgi:hypothetical protein